MLFIRKSISTTSIASRLFSTSTKMTSVKYNFFAGDSHSKIYSKNRPTYPDTLFQEIVKYYEQGNPNHSGSTTCVDIACGTGQATADLVKYFDNVIGVEPAQSQLDNATQHERIKYVNASAEKTTLDSSVANVITVAQALHWFEFDTFFAEMDRILKPKGVLAAWCYVLNIFEKKEAQDALMQLYNGDLGGNWSERRKLVDDHYSTIQFPMTDKVLVILQGTNSI
jgi:ubiquinone/menaquinone biosynthesis C-methylase UbiE